MRVVNLHGIRYILEGDENAAFKLIGTGRARMGQMEASRMGRRNMRSRLNMDTGAVVITETTGRIKQCRIYAPPSDIAQSKEKETRERRIVPAIEVYDDERNFRGLMLSSSGGLNGGWEFIAASRIKGLTPFWVGQWRAYETEKPYEGVLPDREILNEYLGGGRSRRLTDISCKVDLVPTFNTEGSSSNETTIGAARRADCETIHWGGNSYVMRRSVRRDWARDYTTRQETLVYMGDGHEKADEPLNIGAERFNTKLDDHATLEVWHGTQLDYYQWELASGDIIHPEIDSDCRIWWPQNIYAFSPVWSKNDNSWFSRPDGWFPEIIDPGYTYPENGVVVTKDTVATQQGRQYVLSRPGNYSIYTMGVLGGTPENPVGGVVLPVEYTDYTVRTTVRNTVPEGSVNLGEPETDETVRGGTYGHVESVWIDGEVFEYINERYDDQTYVDENHRLDFPVFTHVRYFLAAGKRWLLFSLVRAVPVYRDDPRFFDKKYITEYRLVSGSPALGYEMGGPLVFDEDPGEEWVEDAPDGRLHAAHRFPLPDGGYLRFPEDDMEAFGVGRFRLILDETIRRT